MMMSSKCKMHKNREIYSAIPDEMKSSATCGLALAVHHLDGGRARHVPQQRHLRLRHVTEAVDRDEAVVALVCDEQAVVEDNQAMHILNLKREHHKLQQRTRILLKARSGGSACVNCC